MPVTRTAPPRLSHSSLGPLLPPAVPGTSLNGVTDESRFGLSGCRNRDSGGRGIRHDRHGDGQTSSPSIMGGTHAGFLPAVRARLVTRRRRRRRPWIIVSVLVSEFESQFKFKFRLLNLKFQVSSRASELTDDL